MEHKHGVYDSDTRFSINAVTRQIKSDPKQKTVLMQNDHNSERFTFELPRYIEQHDMSLCNQVEVHYLNSSAKDKGEFRKGLYTVEDLQISPDDPEKVVCSWLISQNATQLVGKLSFRLRFKCVEDGLITYAWHTAIFADVSISDGINADESFEMDYVDIIEQWKFALKREVTDDVNAGVSEWAEVESGKVRGEMTAFSAQWNDALNVERKRIDAFVALKDGSTTGDAELMDVRVDHMGRLWGNAGEAVRGMTKDIDSAFDVYTSPNLLNLEALAVNKGMSQTGREWDLQGLALTDYIQVSEGQVIVYQRSLSDNDPFISPMRWVCAFDANKNVLSSSGVGDDGTSVTSYTVPEGVSFVRVTLGGYSEEVNAANAMVHLGEEIIPYKKYGTTRTVKIVPKKRRLSLPPKLYAFANHPIVLYFRNVLDYALSDVYVSKSGALGNQYDDRWEYTPKTAGIFASALQVYNHDYEELNNHDIRITVKDASEKNTLSVLVIGDSTVDASVETQKMLELARTDEDYSLTLLGTRGTEVNRHEGRSGWTATRYVNEEESAIGVKNAFYNPATKTFDFGYYMESQGYNGVDCVFLQLGINDVFGACTEEDANAAINTYLTNMGVIVDSIHAYSADIKVVINLIIPGEADQDKFGKAYGVSQTAWRYKKNIHEANLALIDKFEGVENVFLSPFNAAIDTVSNMNGDVHPTATGYNQLGAQMYSFMRAIN